MAQMYDSGAPVSRAGITRRLHEWRAALNTVNESAEAEIYDCAAELVVAYLSDHHTFRNLLSAFYAPDSYLTRT
jgi:hypothetical protein